jgi:hypothetical protein
MTKAQDTIVAILSELEESGIRSTMVTSLVKFVYLVDYAQAKASSGNTLTGLAWRFLHFGPFDAALMDDLEALDARHVVQSKSGGGTDKDYQLYSLAEHVQRTTLESLGLAKGVVSRVRQYLQEYAQDQAKLLNFVYFRTEPMESAQPEAVLDFSVCRSDTWQEIKPIKAAPIPPAALKAFRERVAARRAAEDARKRPPIVWQGQFDDTYFSAMALLDADEGVPVDAAGKSGILML